MLQSAPTKLLAVFCPCTNIYGRNLIPSSRGSVNAYEKRVHEISLNPEVLLRPLKETAATLVHEMAHHWQQEFGKPSRTGYHNHEWAERMLAVGLRPVSLDNPGAVVGQRVTHEIVVGGAFEVAFEKLPAAALLPFACVPEPETAKKLKAKNKVKYVCPSCDAAAWGKPELRLVCGDCCENLAAEG